MKCSVENRCIECLRYFCCADCRRNHERSDHGLEYDCPLCRDLKFLCQPKLLTNTKLIKHIIKEHIPLHCSKCEQVFNNMEDFIDIDKCSSVSELVDKEVSEKMGNSAKEVDDKFNSIYSKMTPNGPENFEAIVSINKINKTAVITPIVRKKHIVDYDSSDSDSNSPKQGLRTPYIQAPKTPKLKRAATPHHKKFIIKQRAIDIADEDNPVDSDNNNIIDHKKTPTNTAKIDIKESSPNKEITTPTSRPIVSEKFSKLTASAVTTSTPTHAIPSNWCLFPEQGADSPLSEIEGTTGSPAQSIDNEGSKTELSENVVPKLKSIMMTGSRVKLSSQDSSEKQQTLLDSVNNTEVSSVNKSKRVKFAEDTVFNMEKKVLRVFRKPKRMLTPGPQKVGRFSQNPRFQALINRFEHNGKTLARTPITYRDKREEPQETPPGDHNLNIQARAINFKDDSPVVSIEKSDDKEVATNDLYQSCVESTFMNPNVVIHNAISTLSTNIAGSLQNCLSSAIQTEDEETEIQFKFVITKKKVSIKRIVDDGKDVDEKSCEVKRAVEGNKENIWTSVARAVKKVFWGDQMSASTHLATTPLTRSQSSFDSDLSSASKRKCEDLSDVESPINHKRQKCDARIRGRPSIHGQSRLKPVASLRVSYSADQNSFFKQLSSCKDDTQNLSF